MPSSFAITVTSSTLKLGTERTGAISVTVTNTTNRTLRGRAQLDADPATLLWLTLLGDAERSFAPGLTQQYIVNVAVPNSVPASSATMRLNMIGVDDPDEDFTRGPTVTIEVPAEPEPIKKPFPWWIVAVVVAVVLIGGGVGGWLAWRRVTMPNLVGQTADEAKAQLADVGLILGHTSYASTGAIPDTIIGQDPPAGEVLTRGNSITVTVEAGRVVVPNLLRLTLEQAQKEATRVGLLLNPPTHNLTGQKEQTVTEQSLRPGDEVLRNTPISINIDPGSVTLPSLIEQDSASAQATLQALGVKITRQEISQDLNKVNRVLRMDPKPGTIVSLGSTVTLSVQKQPITVPSLIGKPKDVAVGELTTGAGGLKATTSDRVSYTKAPGTVIEVQPAPGTPILDGATVTLIIALEPPKFVSGQTNIRVDIGLRGFPPIFNLDAVGIDLDSGQQINPGDLGLRPLAPGAILFYWSQGAALFGNQEPSYLDCSASQPNMNISQVQTLQLTNGAYYCTRTSAGRLALVQILRIDNNNNEVAIKYYTWKKETDQ